MLNTLVVGGLGITLVLFLQQHLTLVFGGVPQKQKQKQNLSLWDVHV